LPALPLAASQRCCKPWRCHLLLSVTTPPTPPPPTHPPPHTDTKENLGIGFRHCYKVNPGKQSLLHFTHVTAYMIVARRCLPYRCLAAYVSDHGCCPVTRLPCKASEIRRIYDHEQ
jgi:hypothetical protein